MMVMVIIIIRVILIIQLHSYLLTCKLNSPKANYKVNMNKVELSLCLMKKHYVMKTYGGVEV
jgi:hypothetical protein